MVAIIWFGDALTIVGGAEPKETIFMHSFFFIDNAVSLRLIKIRQQYFLDWLRDYITVDITSF